MQMRGVRAYVPKENEQIVKWWKRGGRGALSLGGLVAGTKRVFT